MGNIKSGRTTHKRRWYDKHKGLSSALEKLRTVNKKDRDNIMEGMKKIIIRKDPDFIDKVCKKFPLNPYKRRWYDENPHLWLVVNSLRYADDEAINEVVRLLIVDNTLSHK